MNLLLPTPERKAFHLPIKDQLLPPRAISIDDLGLWTATALYL